MASSTTLLVAGFAVLTATACPSNRVQRFALDLARYSLRLGLAAFLVACLGLCLRPLWVPDDIAVRLFSLAEPLTRDCGERFRWLAAAGIVCFGTLPVLVLLDFLAALARHAQFARELAENSRRLLEYIDGDLPTPDTLSAPLPAVSLPRPSTPRLPVKRLAEYVS